MNVVEIDMVHPGFVCAFDVGPAYYCRNVAAVNRVVSVVAFDEAFVVEFDGVDRVEYVVSAVAIGPINSFVVLDAPDEDAIALVPLFHPANLNF